MDPDRVLSLARYLRRCRSTPDLSFTAVSLLSKTLTARATRLESTTSRARLEAENEAYKTATTAKRQRALGPKNASEFMRQTIRHREKMREINRVRADVRATQQAEPAIRRRRSLDQSVRGVSSEITLTLPLRETTHSCHSNRSAPLTLGTSRAAGRVGYDGQERLLTSSNDHKLQERNVTPTLSTTPKTDCFNLEDDDDIRVLLDRARSSTSSIRPGTAARPATSGGTSHGKTRPESRHPCTRSPTMVGSPPARGSPSSPRCRDCIRRPHTAGAGSRIGSLGSRKINQSDAVQLRREMLIRSHGEGSNLHLFPAKPFKTTAMGRKACDIDPRRRTELVPWMPAKTLDRLDKLQRSRMLVNQRPVVSPLRSWT